MGPIQSIDGSARLAQSDIKDRSFSSSSQTLVIATEVFFARALPFSIRTLIYLCRIRLHLFCGSQHHLCMLCSHLAPIICMSSARALPALDSTAHYTHLPWRAKRITLDTNWMVVRQYIRNLVVAGELRWFSRVEIVSYRSIPVVCGACVLFWPGWLT